MQTDTITQTVTPLPTFLLPPDTDIAFTHKGHQAAVKLPHMGQAHQQYFTPRWIAEAFLHIAETIYSRDQRAWSPYKLSVVDLTCGAPRGAV